MKFGLPVLFSFIMSNQINHKSFEGPFFFVVLELHLKGISASKDIGRNYLTDVFLRIEEFDEYQTTQMIDSYFV